MRIETFPIYDLDSLKAEIIRLTKYYNTVAHGRGEKSSLELTDTEHQYGGYSKEEQNQYYLVMSWDNSSCMHDLDAEDWKNVDWQNSSNWENCG